MDFIYDVFYSILINIATAIITAVFIFMLAVLRYSNIKKFFTKFINPEKRVFSLSFKNFQIEKLDKTLFKLPIDKSERRILVNLYSSRNNSNPHNGKCIRLDSVEFKQDILDMKISQVEFYDFLSTNLCIKPSNSPIKSFRKLLLSLIKWWKSFEIVDKVKKSVLVNGKINSFEDVIRIDSLANIIAVSIIIIDSTGRIAIVKRTKKVAISSGYFSATAAGTVSMDDFCEENPMEACIVRELKEELGIENLDLKFDACVIPKEKLQPIFCYSAKIEGVW